MIRSDIVIVRDGDFSLTKLALCAARLIEMIFEMLSFKVAKQVSSRRRNRDTLSPANVAKGDARTLSAPPR